MTWLAPLLAAYGMGFTAAAPIGPVNLLAIRRGVTIRWHHALACGTGAMTIDMAYFALVLLGGRWAVAYLSHPQVQSFLAVSGMIVCVPFGFHFLIKAVRPAFLDIEDEQDTLTREKKPGMVADVAGGALLTAVNPMAPAYWAVVGVNWLASAGVKHGTGMAWLGLAAAATGFLTWFLILATIVRFMPNRLGPKFFRGVNVACGLMLLGFGVFCAWIIFTR
jgi:threonine/homoserine/homoserine lactone efflux protein